MILFKPQPKKDRGPGRVRSPDIECHSTEVADYFQQIFRHDWQHSATKKARSD